MGREMIRLAWAIEQLQETLAFIGYMEEACDYDDLQRVRQAKTIVQDVIAELQGEDRESRINYVVDKREKEAEARAAATQIIQGIKHARMPITERQAEADRDNDLLFGTKEERGH